MDEYIDREAVKSAIYEIMDKYDPYDRCDSKAVTALQGADDAIDLIPAADVVPVGEVISVPPHGRLIDADAILEHRFVGVVGEKEKSSYMVGWNNALEAVVENAETILGGE